MKLTALLFALLLIGPAHAQVQRCTIDGKVVFTDRPCPDTGTTVGDVITQQQERAAAQQQQTTEIDAQCKAWLDTDPSIINSVWDGSVYEVKEWFKRNANDPKRVEYLAWSVVHRHCEGYSVQVRVRAPNRFNALVVQSLIFRFNREGRITGQNEINWNP